MWRSRHTLFVLLLFVRTFVPFFSCTFIRRLPLPSTYNPPFLVYSHLVSTCYIHPAFFASACVTRHNALPLSGPILSTHHTFFFPFFRLFFMVFNLHLYKIACPQYPAPIFLLLKTIHRALNDLAFSADVPRRAAGNYGPNTRGKATFQILANSPLIRA